MKKVFIVHGFEGKPNGAWRPWLMRELEKQDVYACALAMPDPYEPQCTAWVAEIARHMSAPHNETYLIGHSLGVPAILHYLDTVSSADPFAGVFLLAGPCEKNPNPNTASFQKLAHFFDRPFPFAALREKAKTFVVMHGDNDPRVPLWHAEKISEALACELVVIPNGGHLNGASGFVTLPPLLEKLTPLLSPTS